MQYINFMVEGVHDGDFRFWIGESRYRTDNERGNIRGISISQYQVQNEFTHSYFCARDEQHCINGITFAGLKFPGGRIRTVEELNPVIEYASGLVITDA